MKRILNNKTIIIIILIIAFFVVMGITSNPESNIHSVRNIITVPFKYVQEFFRNNIIKLTDTVDAIKEKRDLLAENRDLKENINILEKRNRKFKTLQAENDRLREALNLKKRYEDYNIIGGNVISKESGNWFDIFRIDKGTKDGLKEDLAVITHDNSLVGRVYMTDYNSSMIISIIDQTMGISGWISKPGGGAVTVKGDINLKNNGLCRVTDINVEVNIQKGDIIETSGLGGIYPKGLVIGEVISVIDKPSLIQKHAILKPSADFKRINEIFIMKKRDTADVGADK